MGGGGREPAGRSCKRPRCTCDCRLEVSPARQQLQCCFFLGGIVYAKCFAQRVHCAARSAATARDSAGALHYESSLARAQAERFEESFDLAVQDVRQIGARAFRTPKQECRLGNATKTVYSILTAKVHANQAASRPRCRRSSAVGSGATSAAAIPLSESAKETFTGCPPLPYQM